VTPSQGPRTDATLACRAVVVTLVRCCAWGGRRRVRFRSNWRACFQRAAPEAEVSAAAWPAVPAVPATAAAPQWMVKQGSCDRCCFGVVEASSRGCLAICCQRSCPLLCTPGSLASSTTGMWLHRIHPAGANTIPQSDRFGTCQASVMGSWPPLGTTRPATICHGGLPCGTTASLSVVEGCVAVYDCFAVCHG
jgi:hypothetical protein